MMTRALSQPVLCMALAMQEKLDENAQNGGWELDDADALIDKLREEVRELELALQEAPTSVTERHQRRRNIRCEAADVANFAMMLAQNEGDLGGREQDRSDPQSLWPDDLML